MRNKLTLITVFVALMLGAMTLVINTGSTADAQEVNLLTNPGFDDPYSSFTPIFSYQQEQCTLGVCTTAQIPGGWLPWWQPQLSTDEETINRMPEYKPVCPFSPCPYPDRVAGGQQALQYFTFWSTHTAGIYQQVNVPANATLRFRISGQVWSTSDSNSATSKEPSPVDMRIGIDPTGGVNPFSPDIVWSVSSSPYDQYIPFEVVAQAQGEQVTVFTYSAPSSPRKHNDVYWDEASLVTTDGSALVTTTVTDPQTGEVSTVQAPANPNVRFVPAGPTPTPNAQGVIEVLVESGDTLWSIAARAGLSLDELLALNPNLSSNSFINWGDRIVLGRVDGAGTAAGGVPESTEAEVAEAESAEGEEVATESGEAESIEADPVAEEPEPTSIPAPTATPEPAAGAICLLAFDDGNGDGVYDASTESLRNSVAFTISKDQAVVSNYITDGMNEPFCIEGLDPGNYRISRSLSANEVDTNGTNWGASIVGGSRPQFDFGSQMVAISDTAATGSEVAEASMAEESGEADSMVETGTGAMEEAADDSSAADSGGGLVSWIVWIILAIAVILIIGVALVIMSARRATIE
ncbi:MAG: LysM peptidoglycan-binding domain-containing protein [Chloroflexota bacterium]